MHFECTVNTGIYLTPILSDSLTFSLFSQSNKGNYASNEPIILYMWQDAILLLRYHKYYPRYISYFKVNQYEGNYNRYQVRKSIYKIWIKYI